MTLLQKLQLLDDRQVERICRPSARDVWQLALHVSVGKSFEDSVRKNTDIVSLAFALPLCSSFANGAATVFRQFKRRLMRITE